jgi:hypothetical protein
MRGRLMTVIAGAVAMSVVLGGCSKTANGTAVPEQTTTTKSSDSSTVPSEPSPTNDYGAPKVSVPLDATKYLTQPCAALTPAQLQAFNLPVQGEPDLDSAVAKTVGPSCLWRNSDIASRAGVSFITGNRNGLADTYRGHKQGQFEGYWIETAVDGYPAVFTDGTDGRSSGRCGITVGISDTLAFGVSNQDRTKEKSCDRAKHVAEAVVKTLKVQG